MHSDGKHQPQTCLVLGTRRVPDPDGFAVRLVAGFIPENHKRNVLEPIRIARHFALVKLSVAAILVVSGLAAYALARSQFPGRTGFYVLLITGYAIPIHTVLVPLYEMLRASNALNSYAGLILPYVAFGIPFSVLLLYAFFLDFPKELEEAARLDGCNEWQLLARVVAPLSLPGLSSVAIFQGVFIWNEFLLALILISDDGLKTLPFGLVVFQGSYASNWPLLLASVTMATLPILMLYLLLQRQFVNSLAGIGK
jgi:ABC-type glycerol-3-phosphate transport system permease component